MPKVFTAKAARDYPSHDIKKWRAYIRQRIKVDPKTGCWVWQLSRFAQGYGQAGNAKYFGLDRYAHRVSYSVFKGPIPPGLKVRHKCHNPPCCNPAHLLLGTQRDNMLDNLRSGLSITMKLTPAKVARIRQLLMQGMRCNVIATQFGMSAKAISHIKTGRRWA